MQVNEKSNRLINEKSPYLLQHAYNPVDWYPWGKDAFKKAKVENKPIFLSVGYSSCHWCHVMEEESFEDKDVAKILNENFVSIKVDREERPDIDSIYMSVCQALTGSGGWPLSVFLTPDKKPFYAGTYYPKKSRYGMPGFVDILNSAINAWKDDQERIISSSENLTNALVKLAEPEYEEAEEELLAENAKYQLYSAFDDKYGGFGTAPKFPTPHNLLFLLRYWNVNKDEKSLEIVESTLKGMYKGGMFDHIGYGFSRYSTDEKWLVPHFEKMLYDNALLAYTYVEAYAATKNILYKEAAEKIFTYVLRDMRSDNGGFYSAEDADSEGVEGKFYVWTVDEIEKILGPEQSEVFCEIYNITEGGNFEGKNIPNLIDTDIDELEENGQLRRKIYAMTKELYRHREERIHPFKDDKILTSWNGLMIAALAYGGRTFGNEEYIKAAEASMEFIMKNLVREDGRLLARYREGEAAHAAYLDDYAFIVWGFIELYEAAYNLDYLKNALSFNDDMLDLFWDINKGGFFLYGRDAEQLIVRPKEVYDGAIPSGNSTAAHNMLRLYKITGDKEVEKKAQTIFKLFAGRVRENPLAYSHFISAVLENETPGVKVVIAGNLNEEDAKEMIEVANEIYNPFKVVIINNEDEKLYDLIPMLQNQNKIDGKTTAYVCKGVTCKKPTTEIEELKALIEENIIIVQ